MAKSTSISSVQGIADPQTGKVVGEIKEVIETLTGRRAGAPKITKLLANATTADIIVKINAIIDRLQS